MQKKHKASSFFWPQIFSKSKTGMLWIFLPCLPLPSKGSAALGGAGYDSEAGCLK